MLTYFYYCKLVYTYYIYICRQLEVIITKTLTLSLPVLRWESDDTDLHLEGNILWKIRVNTAFTKRFIRNIQLIF